MIILYHMQNKKGYISALKRGLPLGSPLFFEHFLSLFKKSFLGICMALGYAATGQIRVEGQVSDALTRQPLAGVSVYLAGQATGTFTDEHGMYSLSVPFGVHTLRYTILGYTPEAREIRTAGDSLILHVVLNPSVVSLTDVVVLGKTEARKLRDQAMPVSVLEIQKLGGAVNKISDVLNKTAGVIMRNSGGVGSASRISVRGLEGKRIGLFMEGLPLADNSEYNQLNAVPVDQIERIEVYKGVVPARFGGSAMGGAVNLVLKEYPPLYAETNYTTSSFHTHQFSTGIKQHHSDKGYLTGLSMGYTRSANDYFMELPLQKGTIVKRDHDVYEKKSAGISFASTRWWFDKFEVESAFFTTRKEIQGVEYNIQHAEQNVQVFSGVNRLTKQDLLIQGLDLDVNHIYSYSVFRFSDTSSQRYRWDGTPYIAASRLGGEIGNDANATFNRAHQFMQRLNLNFIINTSHTFNFNSQYTYSKGIPSDTLRDAVFGYKTHFNSLMNSWVAGLSHEYTSNDHRLANILSAKFYYYGMHSEKLRRISSPERDTLHVNQYDFGISNAFRYRLTQHLQAKASGAYEVRLPTEQELLGDGFLTAPATDLRPEKNRSLNLSLLYEISGKTKRFQLEMNIFYMHLTDMIRFTGGMLQFQYQNFGEMRTLGADLDIRCDATSWLYLYANATYQDLRDVRKYEHGTVLNFTKGQRMPNIPYHMANTGVELHRKNLLHPNSLSRLFADVAFVEGYYYKFRQSNLPEDKIPGYLVFNLGLEHNLLRENVLLSVQVNNLTNSRVLSEFNRPLPGRNYALKLRYFIRSSKK